MKRKIWAIALCITMIFTLAACAKEEEETTISGMVVSVDGSVIQLMETSGDMTNQGNREQSGKNQRPSMPGNMEGFDPEQFGGTMPEGMEGFDPENFQRPEGETRPEGERPTMPEGETRPQGGFSGGRFNLEGVETKSVDIGNAHISKQVDGVKESASLSDIQPGTMVTITLNSKGEATYVLITSTGFGGGFGGFGGGFGGGNFGGGNRPNRPDDTTTPTN